MRLNDVLASASDYIGKMARESDVKDKTLREDAQMARNKLSNAIGAQNYSKKAINIEYAKDYLNRILVMYDLNENDRRKVIQIINELDAAETGALAKLRNQKAKKGRKKPMKAGIKRINPVKMAGRAIKIVGV